jgi:hypothetical protein
VNHNARYQDSPHYPQEGLMAQHLRPHSAEESPVIIDFVIARRGIDPREDLEVPGHVPNNEKNQYETTKSHRNLLTNCRLIEIADQTHTTVPFPSTERQKTFPFASLNYASFYTPTATVATTPAT